MKILKQYCNVFWTLSFPSTISYNHLKKQGSNFTSLVALILSPEFDVLFHFSLASFLIAFTKIMNHTSHSQMCNKNSCSVKLHNGSFHYSPRKIPVDVFISNKLVIFLIQYTVLKTNSNFIKKIYFGYILPNSCFTEQLSLAASEYTNKCNTNFFSVCKAKYAIKTQKMNTQDSKERKFEEKVRNKG